MKQRKIIKVIDNDIYYDDIDDLSDEDYEYLKREWLLDRRQQERDYWNDQF